MTVSPVLIPPKYLDIIYVSSNPVITVALLCKIPSSSTTYAQTNPPSSNRLGNATEHHSFSLSSDLYIHGSRPESYAQILHRAGFQLFQPYSRTMIHCLPLPPHCNVNHADDTRSKSLPLLSVAILTSPALFQLSFSTSFS